MKQLFALTIGALLLTGAGCFSSSTSSIPSTPSKPVTPGAGTSTGTGTGTGTGSGNGSGSPGDTVFCTQDAKLCPDGSYVARHGPDCEFDPCPGR